MADRTPIELRLAVRWFAEQMEQNLRRNEKYGCVSDPDALLARFLCDLKAALGVMYLPTGGLERFIRAARAVANGPVWQFDPRATMLVAELRESLTAIDRAVSLTRMIHDY